MESNFRLKNIALKILFCNFNISFKWFFVVLPYIRIPYCMTDFVGIVKTQELFIGKEIASFVYNSTECSKFSAYSFYVVCETQFIINYDAQILSD